VDELVERRPDEVKRVVEPIEPRFGMTAVAAALERRGQFPAIYFQKLVGSEVPALLNLTASYDRLALALGTTPQEMIQVYSARQGNPIAPRIVETGPVKEVIWTGEDADLTRLPLPVHNELDGGPYITAACLAARHPQTGVMNVGLYRHQVLGPHEMTALFLPGHHGHYIHQAYEQLGQRMPVALSIGHHPAVALGVVSRIPGMGGEYEEAGALLEEPLELVKAETSDLLVPARAEIVIEGYLEPGVRVHEGPFAEWPGLYTGQGPQPVITVTTITMRRDAVFYDVFAGHRDHQVLGSLPRMGSIFTRVKQAVPGLKAVNIPAHVRMHCYISYRKQTDAEAKKAAFAALLTEPENLNTIVLVDDDIDVFNEAEVTWALGTRFSPDRDLHIIPAWSGPGGPLPPSWDFHPDGTKTERMMPAMIMDATKPLPPADFPPRVAVPTDFVDAVDLDRLLQPYQG
jgi:2,5-furandicarboxylate decarboxylase 1